MGSDTHAGPAHGPAAEDPGVVVPPFEPTVLRWRQAFPGEERQLATVRRWLVSLLPDCPARDDVISVATELASNAVRHTTSGQSGRFGVEITRYPAVVRVAVTDSGGPGEPRVIDDITAENGRGLLLVHGLSVRTGIAGSQRGRLVWADIAFEHPDGVLSGQAPYEAGIREEQAALARRFAGVPVWFGRSTLAWWALAGPDSLINAPSGEDLAGQLRRLRPRSRGPDPRGVQSRRRSAPGLALRTGCPLMPVRRRGRRPPLWGALGVAGDALGDGPARPLAARSGVLVAFLPGGRAESA